MPRRSGQQNPDVSPLPRRTSARIAAVQAASPAKSPAKSPRQKRQVSESKKAVIEDDKSQQSQVKNELGNDELNGTETSSSIKDHESTEDQQETPAKKTKVDDVSAETSGDNPTVDETDLNVQGQSNTDDATDFVMIEKHMVPPPDSEEVQAAISVQGKDGQLLVDYVQVDKDELPVAASLEVNQAPVAEQTTHPEEHASTVCLDLKGVAAAGEAPVRPAESSTEALHITTHSNPSLSSVNGATDSQVLDREAEEANLVEPSADSDAQAKTPVDSELQSQSLSPPASGDNTANHAASEVVAP